MRTSEDIFPYLMHFQCHYDEAVVIHLDGKHSPAPAMLRLRHPAAFFVFTTYGATRPARDEPRLCPTGC